MILDNRFEWSPGDAEVYDTAGDFCYPVAADLSFQDWRGAEYWICPPRRHWNRDTERLEDVGGWRLYRREFILIDSQEVAA